jgi:hypothetical protein
VGNKKDPAGLPGLFYFRDSPPQRSLLHALISAIQKNTRLFIPPATNFRHDLTRSTFRRNPIIGRCLLAQLTDGC